MKLKNSILLAALIATPTTHLLADQATDTLPAISFSKKNKKNKKKKEPKKAIPDTSAFLLDEGLWEMSLDDFLKKNNQFQFKWLSKEKNGLRSEGYTTPEHSKKITTFGVPTGEIIIRKARKNRNVGSLTIFYYNQGDDGSMSSPNFKSLAEKAKQTITEKTGSKPSDISKKGVVNLKKWIWKRNNTAYLLEISKGQFIRLRAASLKSNRDGESTANRSSLKSNVSYDRSSGDVYIRNIPMVDQGRKGYCACATTARIYQYYGRTTDQHEIAQIAGSTAQGGTSPAEMIAAIKKVTKNLHTKVLVLYEYPKGIGSKLDRGRGYKKYESGIKELMKDINSYQKLAKKKGVKGLRIDGEEYKRVPRHYTVSTQLIYSETDPETYREVMIKKSSYNRFQRSIEKYINQGIPVAWGLQLGMFKEQGLPQSRGGHMRLIIGYNKKTKELIYSDSWGEGHGKKKMDMGNAFTMTSMLLVLPPNK